MNATSGILIRATEDTSGNWSKYLQVSQSVVRWQEDSKHALSYINIIFPVSIKALLC